MVLGKEKTAIYVDGEEVASTPNITIRPSDFRPVMNYLGRSQFLSDPMLSAWLDDVRVYNYALSANEVKQVYQNDPTVGITTIEEPDNKPEVIYGLDGIRRDRPQTGIVIKNNKKVVN